MEIRDGQTHDLVLNMTSSVSPSFSAKDLVPNTGYIISIFGANIKGRSDRVNFHVFTNEGEISGKLNQDISLLTRFSTFFFFFQVPTRLAKSSWSRRTSRRFWPTAPSSSRWAPSSWLSCSSSAARSSSSPWSSACFVCGGRCWASANNGAPLRRMSRSGKVLALRCQVGSSWEGPQKRGRTAQVPQILQVNYESLSRYVLCCFYCLYRPWINYNNVPCKLRI